MNIDKAKRALGQLRAASSPKGPTRQAAELGLAAIEDLEAGVAAGRRAANTARELTETLLELEKILGIGDGGGDILDAARLLANDARRSRGEKPRDRCFCGAPSCDLCHS